MSPAWQGLHLHGGCRACGVVSCTHSGAHTLSMVLALQLLQRGILEEHDHGRHLCMTPGFQERLHRAQPRVQRLIKCNALLQKAQPDLQDSFQLCNADCGQQAHSVPIPLLHETCKCCWHVLQKSTPNLEGAFKYLSSIVGSSSWTPEVAQGIEEAAGVGVVVTPDEIKATIGQHIDKVKPELVEKRFTSTVPQLHERNHMQCMKCALQR